MTDIEAVKARLRNCDTHYFQEGEICIDIDANDITVILDALDAAEARHVVDQARIARLDDALKPFAAAVFNDNGDVTISTGHIVSEDYSRAAAARQEKP